MFVWKSDNSQNDRQITLTNRQVVFKIGGEEKRVSRYEFAERENFIFAVRHFSFEIAVEICALILDGVSSENPTGNLPHQDRPTCKHRFSDGRKGAWFVWFFGKTIRAQIHPKSGMKALNMTFKEYLKSGFPTEFQTVIGGEKVQQITIAVQQLLPLKCLCGTGVKTVGEHGSLRCIVQKQHPFAPFEVSITVARCTVCGQGWSFEKSGDSHYSYSYSVDSFPSKCLL